MHLSIAALHVGQVGLHMIPHVSASLYPSGPVSWKYQLEMAWMLHAQ